MTHVLKAYKPASGIKFGMSINPEKGIDVLQLGRIKFGMSINPVKGIYVLQLGRTVQLEMCT